MSDPIDLDRELDELLARTSLAELIACAPATESLQRASAAKAFLVTTAGMALDAFDVGLAPTLPGLTKSDLGELERHLNAFAVRARLSAIAGSEQAPQPSDRPNDVALTIKDPTRIASAPDEVLSRTTLREIIFWSSGGETLRRRLGKVLKSPLMDTLALDFIADDEAEERYAELIGVSDYLKLAELVNAFTLTLHRDYASVR